MRIFERVGKKTDMFIRFSTVAASRGGPDVARDPRGFAMKYYTEDGNWDLVGNNTPVFFIRDGIKFPDFIHSQKQDPYTNRQEPDNVWDFFSHSPEATHQFTWLFGDRGIPASYRCMDGFGSHTFQWVNAQGERLLGEVPLQDRSGHQDLHVARKRRSSAARISSTATRISTTPSSAGDFPSWTLKVQVMPEADAATYRIDPFDLTKVWNYATTRSSRSRSSCSIGCRTTSSRRSSRRRSIRRTSCPASGRRPIACCRRGCSATATRIAIASASTTRGWRSTAPKGVPGGAQNYGRDGFMPLDGRTAASKNYEPNSFDGPVQTNEEHYAGFP